VQSLRTSTYPLLLPALQAIPSLTNVTLAGLSDIISIKSHDEAPALAMLLRSDQFVRVELSHLYLNNDADVWMEVFSNARVKALHINGCTAFDPARLGQAFSNSRLEELTFTNLSFFDDEVPASFLNSLATSLPTMLRLRTLHWNYDDVKKIRDSNEYNDAMANVVRAVSQCPQLVSLHITLYHATEDMDRALACCVRGCLFLTDLEVSYKKSPAAKRKSKLEGEDRQARDNTNTFLKLNQAGRGYIATDPANKVTATQVLGSVSSRLDCLFSHMCENPAICSRAGATVDGGPSACRKRKTHTL
jgi:hypothetical protein